jgi:hypothetical protein
MPRRWFGRLTLLAVVLTSIIGAVLINTIDAQRIDRLRSDIENVAPLMAVTRLLLIAGLFMAWPSLLNFCQRRNWINKDTSDQLLAKRTRLALWLIALELVLGVEILNYLHTLINWLSA